VVEYRARMVDRCPLLVAAFAKLDQPGAVAMSTDEWIMDRQLGPYNVVEVRLGAADTVIFLDSPLCDAPAERCGGPANGSISSSGCCGRRRSRLFLMKAIVEHVRDLSTITAIAEYPIQSVCFSS